MVFHKKVAYQAPQVSVIALGQEGVICTSPPGDTQHDYEYVDLDEVSLFLF